jgi:hypothetical protein
MVWQRKKQLSGDSLILEKKVQGLLIVSLKDNLKEFRISF